MSTILTLGFVALLVLVWLGRGGSFARPQWRTVAGLLAIGAAASAALFAVRGAWPVAAILGASAASLAMASRTRLMGRRPDRSEPPVSGMSEADARATLGVGPDAGREEVEAAYRRLMLRVHPDHGGASGLAAQLNAARKRLLG